MLSSIKDFYCRIFNLFFLSRKSENGFIDILPQEIVLKIFLYLNSQELASCLRVNRKWKVLAEDQSLWEVLFSGVIFGKKQWTAYMGDIPDDPCLPKGFCKILESPCPFWPEKKVKETHLLVFVPKVVNNNPLTLITLGRCASLPKKGHGIPYRPFLGLQSQSRAPLPFACSNAQSQWVLMTKFIIPQSGNKSYEEQAALLEDLAKRIKVNYEIPKTIEAVACMVMKYVTSQKGLFGDSSIYTRCQEIFYDSHVMLNGGSSQGLHIGLGLTHHKSIGIAPVRKWTAK